MQSTAMPRHQANDQRSGTAGAPAVLVCDDDVEIVGAIRTYLENEGYPVLCAYNGRQVLDVLECQPDIRLLILDLMMPEMDGLQAIGRIRAERNLPILILSAKSEDRDKVFGLNLGADDYLTKPFNPRELIARCKSLLRRYLHLGSLPSGPAVHCCGGLCLDEESRSVTLDEEPVNLTGSEFRILSLLIKNPGRLYTSAEIYEQLWGNRAVGCENVIAVHIRHIREKIEFNPREPRYLKVVWGQGYRLESPEK